MKTRLKIFLLAASILIPAGLVDAAVRQGSVELGFSGAYSRLRVADSKVRLRLLDVSAGYFVTPEVQISGMGGYLHSKIDGEKMKALTLGAGLDYHFMTRTQFVPYVGGALRWADFDAGAFSKDDWAWELRAGAKQFLNRNTAIKYQISYLEFDDVSIHGTNFSVGISFFF
ncbi:MAG TPA: outer membrane beta-barrel protein [Opitutales bacterium]|nr:outer membrane beta-barrel protein [Opitutales bacterium]